MADRINSHGLKSLPVRPYDKVRDKLKAGDLLFASGECCGVRSLYLVR